MTQRLPCKTPGCARTTLPSTAEETGGYCMPCAQRQWTEEHERRTAAHRVDVDRFAGVTDPVEILLLIHQPPSVDELKNHLPYPRKTVDLYRSLSQAQADELLRRAARDPELVEEIAGHLASFCPIDLAACQVLLLKGSPCVCRPAHAFRAAGPAVVDRLFDLLDRAVRDASDLLLDHVLSALAWTRSARVIEAVARWQAAPPAWSPMLYWSPHEYTKLAGYEVESEQVRELILPGAMALVRSDGGASPSSVHATVLERDPRGKPCPRCRKPSSILIRFEPGAPSSELQRRGLQVVPTCLECACFELLTVGFAADGAWDWIHPGGGPSAPESDYSREVTPITATLVPRQDWEAVDWCGADGISQVGGHPSWINDPSYPPCPRCSRTMMTVAQVALADFFSAEGVYYVHHCEACAVVSVSYDQS